MVKNVFRILGDVSHTVSKCILIWAIHSNKSAEGVSLITQALYVAVFCTRYLDLFWVPPAVSLWNFTLKNFYIFSSLYIIFLMMRMYARTREREKAWKLGAACLAGSLISAPFVMMVFEKKSHWGFMEFLWTFSLILESVCVLPQLLLLRQTTVPTVIDSFYLLTLGSYRAFYILNWILRYFVDEFKPSTIAVIFGIVQTAFYLDFAWVYWTRQRVKLRNGGIVDSEDLSRGWLTKFLGRGVADIDEEARPTTDGAHDEETGRQVGSQNRWGARGVSVSADDGVSDSQPIPTPKSRPRSVKTELNTKPDEVAGILHDDESDDSDEDELPSIKNPIGVLKDVGNGNEWRETNR
ncbi:hypothetical protein MMC19_005606 [Ptychographa xylographoides]|nr:hypothetical protein [Ptychographa xylographoides]